MMTINVLIVDDHAIVRGGLKEILATTDDIVTAEEAAEGQEALKKIRQMATLDLVLLDMTMPGLSGVHLIERIRSVRALLPILVLSMHDEAQVALRALRAGAAGYLTKDSDPAILLAAIRKVAGGGRFIDPLLVDSLVFDAVDDDKPAHAFLSNREYQVLEMIVRGQSVTDIAAVLNLSAKTISTHKTRLMQKLSVDTNADLIRYALRHRLIDD